MAQTGGFMTAIGFIRTAVAHFLVGAPRLLYEAGFADRNLAPVVDVYQLGAMQLTSTNAIPLSDDMLEVISASSDFPRGGARLTIERSPAWAKGTIAIGPVVHPFPSNLSIFKLSATFSSPAGPHGPNTWAVVVHARQGCEPDTATPATRIAVTLQAAPKPGPRVAVGARVNTVGGAPPGSDSFGSGAGTGEFLPDEVFDQLFPGASDLHTSDGGDAPRVVPPEPEPVFTLDVLVDRTPGVGHATLYVRAAPGADGVYMYPGPNYPVGYTENRAFIHPYIPASPANVISAAGVNIALTTDTNGPASVTLRDFRIYGLTRWDETGGPALAAGSGAGTMFRTLRKQLIDWAFDRPEENVRAPY